MTLNLSVTDEQLGKYIRRVFAVAGRLEKSLPFELVMDELQKIHDGQFNAPDVTTLPRHVPKFIPLTDLGIVTVPDDYVHETHFVSFRAKNRDKCKGRYCDGNIDDANWRNPSRVLKPGDRFHVQAWLVAVEGTTSEACLAFLKMLNSSFVGAQGASLVFEQKRDQLVKGYWYGSFDKKDRLWKDRFGDVRLPGLAVSLKDDPVLALGHFSQCRRAYSVILSFCDEAAGVLTT